MSWKHVILMAVCISFGLKTFGQQVEFKASLDSTTLLIGEQTTLTLNVRKPDHLDVAFTSNMVDLHPALEVLGISEVDTNRLENEWMELSRAMTITSFDSGYHVISPIPLHVLQENGKVDTITTNPLALTILLVPVDTSQSIKPIKALEEMPVTFREMLPWILGSILFLLVGFFIYYYIRRRQLAATETIAPQKPKEAPHVIALRELEQLKTEKLWQNGEVKAYHSKLSEIIRAYIEDRYQILALEQTNDEIFSALENNGLSKEVPFETLKQLLSLADLVKFAKGNPQPTENSRSLEQAYQFVRETIQKPKLAEPEKVNDDA